MQKIIALSLSIFITLFANVSNVSAEDVKQSIFDTSSLSLFSNDDEFLSVDDAFNLSFEQQGQRLSLSFNVAKGYYLYRHQFKFSTENATITPVELPTGKDHEDEFFGIQQIFTEPLYFTVNLEQANENATFTLRYQGCAEKGLCYPPVTKTFNLSATELASSNQQDILSAIIANDTENTAAANTITNIKNNNENTPKKITVKSEQNQLADMLKQDSLLLTLLAFFVGGLLLSFTPCVFPMYPILTGIIVGQGKNLTTKKAFTLSFFYVQGMAITYTLLGIVVALAGAQFQAMFQHPFVLISLSALFIFLALSMFGIFNLALPSEWQNKLNNLSNKQKGGSITGVIIMGVLSGLVASPCTTAPLTGALLYISQSGDVVLGALALYALSLGMGLPLLIIGSSGGKILPKAGNWMTVIKNVFGFLLLAVPILLLDRIIPTVATQLLSALLILATASYFYVVNQASANKALSQPSSSFWYGLRVLIIFLMMFIGATLAYKIITPDVPTTVISSNGTNNTVETNDFVLVANLTELQSMVEKANKQGKNVMVDLYADWCIACKEFEHYTFSESNVQAALQNTLLLKVDLTDTDTKANISLMEYFNVLGLPSILFFNQQGKELTDNRVTGFMNAEEFTAHIHAIF